MTNSQAAGRSDAILRAVVDAAHRFLGDLDWHDEVESVLAELGSAAEASRVYVFENYTEDDGALHMTGLFEWTAPGVASANDDPHNVNAPWSRAFAEIGEKMAARESMTGPVNEFPEAARLSMEAEDIRSIALVPIFAGETWWGFIGFDDCLTERHWEQIEIDALGAAADLLGAAILRRKKSEEFTESESRFRVLVEHLPAIIYTDTLDEFATTTYVSPRIEVILGYTQEEWLARERPWYESLHPEDRERAWSEYLAGRDAGDYWAFEYRMVARDERIVWFREEGILVRDEDGKPLCVQGVMNDITDSKLKAEALQEAESKYRAVIEQIPAITYLDPVDENAMSMYVSPQVETILGCTPDLWLSDGSWWHKHIHPDDESWVWENYERSRESGQALSQEYRMVRDDGRVVWIREDATLLNDEKGEPWAIQGLMHDVTDMKEAQERLAYLGSHDKLTGLANRAMFEQQLQPVLDRAGPRGHSVAVLVLDIDDFKKINDDFGHHIGDRLLKEVATRISRAVEEKDLVSRENADRFLLMLADLEPPGDGADGGGESTRDAAEKATERIRARLSSPAVIGGHTITPSMSIGMSVYPGEAKDLETLLKNADAAMHKEKMGHRQGLAPGS